MAKLSSRQKIDKASPILHIEYRDQFEIMTPDELSTIIKGMFKLVDGEDIEDEIRDNRFLWSIWCIIRDRYLGDRERYESAREAHANAGSKGGRPASQSEEKPNGFYENHLVSEKTKWVHIEKEQEQENNPNPDKEQYRTEQDSTPSEMDGTPVQVQSCAVPGRTQVYEYYKANGSNPAAAERFYSHQVTVGWKDKEGNPLRNWQAVAHTWIEKDMNPTQPIQRSGRVLREQSYQQREYEASTGMPDWMREMIQEEEAAKKPDQEEKGQN